VGGKAQRATYRAVTGDLKLAYAQFEELESFSRFGARLDENTHKIIEHGKRIRACLKQAENRPVPVASQIFVLLALTEGLLDLVPMEKVKDAENALQEAAGDVAADLRARFETADTFSDEDRKALLDVIRKTLAPFQAKPKETE